MMKSSKVEINEHSVAASAPGKVILFGEHSVVYGKPAIAAALSDLRISVLLTPMNFNSSIQIMMPDMGLEVSLTKSCLHASPIHQKLDMPPSGETVSQIESFIQTAREKGDLRVISSSEDGLLPIIPVVYLLEVLAPAAFWASSDAASSDAASSGLKLWVRSKDLPVGAGLGSSAAFSVALAAALFQWKKRDVAASNESVVQPTLDEVNEINLHAFASESLLHGTPSGLDNAVSSHGGALWHTKVAGDSNMELLGSFPKLQLILVHTRVPRSTKALVAGVRTLYNRHARIVLPILDAMGEIAIRARSILEEKDSILDQKSSSSLLELVRLNQDCLHALGVSHPRLDRISDIVQNRYSRVAAAKLTGAGGGGCALVLFCPSDDDDQQELVLQEIRKELELHNYSIYQSKVGGPGVVWESPHVFSSMSAVQNKNGSTEGMKKRYALFDGDKERWILPAAAFLGGFTAYFIARNFRRSAVLR